MLVSIIFSVSPRDLTDSLHVVGYEETRGGECRRTLATVHQKKQRHACCQIPVHRVLGTSFLGRDDATTVADSLNARYMRARFTWSEPDSRPLASASSFISGVYIWDLSLREVVNTRSKNIENNICDTTRCGKSVEIYWLNLGY